MTGYDAAYAEWRADPEGWWLRAARGIDWITPPRRAFDAAAGPYGRWFPDATLNTCHNAVDRHVAAGRGAETAIIYDSPMTGQVRHIPYAELQARTARLAGALAARGVRRGDRVIIYMPMVPEAAIAMLACARLGAIHSVVFGGFAAAELAARIEDATPRAVISASCGLEPGRVVAYKPLLDAAIGMAAHKPEFCLILQRPQGPCALTPGRDHDYAEAEAAGAPHPCVAVAATDPLYILYTSGTTGKPKGIVRDNGGHAVALHNSMRMIYGVGPAASDDRRAEAPGGLNRTPGAASDDRRAEAPGGLNRAPGAASDDRRAERPGGLNRAPDAASDDRRAEAPGGLNRAPDAASDDRRAEAPGGLNRTPDIFWTASDVGWVVGHSYIVYAPLLAGCTSVLFEGKPVGTPDPGTFWRVCAEHGVKLLFTAPTAIRAIRKEDPDAQHMARHDLSRLEALYLAGERCDPPTAEWAAAKLGKPVVDHWWQTETGWPITAGFRQYGLFAPRPGAGGRPSPGFDVRCLDATAREVAPGEEGALVLRLPLPPGCAPTLWNADARYREAYLATFPGHYDSSDAGMVDADGFVWVMGRTDDIINVAGHRLSTGAMEEVLASHADVAECAVVGAADSLKGQVPLGLVVLKAGVARAESEVAKELVALVRERIGPVAAFKDARVVPRLPKTRSGKILRASIRRIADGQAYTVPPTIDDPLILDEIAAVLGRANA